MRLRTYHGCDICGSKTTTRRLLDFHVYSVHMPRQPDPEPRWVRDARRYAHEREPQVRELRRR